MSYKSEVLLDSPLAYWRMTDVGGSATMVAQTGSNGTHGNPTAGNQAIPSAIKNDVTDYSIRYNGTNQYSTASLNLSAQSRISVEFWAYAPLWDVSDGLWIEHGSSAFIGSSGWVVDPNNSTVAGTIVFGPGLTTGVSQWTDRFPQPSALTWHHYVFDMNRATPVNLAYVDGQLQTLTTQIHNAGTYGNYPSSTLYFASRTANQLFAPVNTILDEVAIYAGGLSAARVLAHYNAAQAIGTNNYQSMKVGDGMSTGEKIR